MYKRDIFYTVPEENVIPALDWLYDRSESWWVDSLPGPDGSYMRRGKVDMTFEQYKELIDEHHIPSFVHRVGLKEEKPDTQFSNYRRWSIESGGRVMGNSRLGEKDYFLWIFTDEKYLEEFINLFKAEKI